MTYPNINPIEPGKDGWGTFYDTPARRLLHLCGLIPTDSKNWVMNNAKVIPGWVVSWDCKPLKLNLASVRDVLLRLGKLRGSDRVRDILKVHANAYTLMGVKPAKYQAVYVAAMTAIDEQPVRRLPPPERA